MSDDSEVCSVCGCSLTASNSGSYSQDSECDKCYLDYINGNTSTGFVCHVCGKKLTENNSGGISHSQPEDICDSCYEAELADHSSAEAEEDSGSSLREMLDDFDIDDFDLTDRSPLLGGPVHEW